MNNNESPNKVLVSTTQRCGSSWITSMCARIYEPKKSAIYVPGVKLGMLHLSGSDPQQDEVAITAFSKGVREHGADVGVRVFKTHDLPPRLFPLFLEHNPDFHIVNVIRDFRDVLISRLMYNRYYLPAIGHPLESAFVSENPELSDLELVRRFYGTPEMLDWLSMWKLFSQPVSHPRYLCLKYEELLDIEKLKETIRVLGPCLLPEPLSEETVDKVAADCVFGEIDLNLKRDRKQREVKSDFCRKGVAGDFERFLTKHQSDVLNMLMS